MSQAPKDAELSARIVAQLQRFGTDQYNHAHHPLIRMVQDYRPRCIQDCTCGGCRVWRAFAAAILDHVEKEEPPSA